jgi:hypothetical protein
MSERDKDGQPGVGYWDESIREAKACGEVLVVRGDVGAGTFELEVVELKSDVPDPFGDACERAFEGV